MPPRRPARSTGPRRTRTPEATRDRLLGAAFQEIHRRGYQAASIDSILASTGLTKGALYHHFADKAALGPPVCDEVVRALPLRRWTTPVSESQADAVSAIQGTLRTV